MHAPSIGRPPPGRVQEENPAPIDIIPRGADKVLRAGLSILKTGDSVSDNFRLPREESIFSRIPTIPKPESTS